MTARKWGEWTEVKLDALGGYLAQFVRACQKSRTKVYFDLFAGGTRNENRDTGREFLGSAERALRLSPGFSHLAFFELDTKAAATLQELIHSVAPEGRAIVVPGDCNDEVPKLLKGLNYNLRFAPAFAFIDQYAAEVHWETIKALATYKIPGRTKPELWLYFGDSLYPRGLGQTDPAALARFEARLTLMYGSEEWKHIRDARRSGLLDPDGARFEYINFMRWRLERVLGYRMTIPLKVVNDRGQPLYTMIFATDHPAGEKIMSWVYGLSTERFRQMLDKKRKDRELRKREAIGQYDLFGGLGDLKLDNDAAPKTTLRGRARIEHEPPTKPFWLS